MENNVFTIDYVKQIFDDIIEQVYVVDVETKNFVYVNQAFLQHWGEPENKKCYELLQKQGHPCEFCSDKYVTGKNINKTYTWEWQNLVNKRWYKCIDKCLKWNNKIVKLELAIDITDKKQLLEELEQKKLLLDSIFEVSGASILVTTNDGVFINVNQAFCDLVSFPSIDLIGHSGLELGIWASVFDRENAFDGFSKENKIFLKEIQIYDKNKKVKHCLASASIIRYEGEECILSILVDITDKKEIEFQIYQYSKELEHMNTELKDFVYIASHDLQEPLRATSTYCQLIEKTLNDNKIKNKDIIKYSNYVVESVARMRQMIQDLLEYSKIDDKSQKIEKVSLKNIIKDILKDYSLIIKETKASIQCSQLPNINAIRIRMRQLFQNLISNSLKFKSEKGPIITINYTDEGEHFLFKITDNGVGIKPELQGKIFGLFKRLYTTEEYPGTGIGLALCKKIVEFHGGKIWVESDGKRGTTIFFILKKC